jgi:hypothetical protein
MYQRKDFTTKQMLLRASCSIRPVEKKKKQKNLLCWIAKPFEP